MKIKVAVGRTYNTGNYTSLRLDVGVEKDFIDDSEMDEQDEDRLFLSAYLDLERVLEKMEREAKVRK